MYAVRAGYSSGIGGGGFMTVRLPPTSPNTSSEVYSIDFREVAPGLSNTTMFIGRPEAARHGGLSVGVPGELRGLEEAHKRWGVLPWSTVVQPAADLAKGWKVGRELGQRLQVCDLNELARDMMGLVLRLLDIVVVCRIDAW